MLRRNNQLTRPKDGRLMPVQNIYSGWEVLQKIAIWLIIRVDRSQV
jgi:hypothetical protein